ncbi:MAG: hypothetical protein V1871_09370 [Planctomycetota bacterium]
MSKGKQFIPKDNNAFYPWQGNFVNLVVTNAVAWGIPAPAVTALVARRAEYEPLYWTAQNKTTRNRTDVLAHREIREIYEKEIRTFVRNYCGPLSNTDKSDLGLTVRDIEPTPRGKIELVPYIFLKAIGGGVIEVRSQTEKDATRVSMHPLADGIECRWLLVPKGEMPPEGYEDAKKTVVSRKARFTIDCGDKNAGDSFYGFFRWVNTSVPANSGLWTKALRAVIA